MSALDEPLHLRQRTIRTHAPSLRTLKTKLADAERFARIHGQTSPAGKYFDHLAQTIRAQIASQTAEPNH